MTHWDRRTFLRTSAQAAAIATIPYAKQSLAQPAHTASSFPQNFYWGASTSAMQIEGSPYADAGGRSIWGAFEAKPGAIKDNSTNWVADDEYHRFAEDIGHMRDLGLNAYRFSMSWPRILPQGKGQANEKALAYYDQVVDGSPRRKDHALRHRLSLRLSRRPSAAKRLAQSRQLQMARRLRSPPRHPLLRPRHQLAHHQRAQHPMGIRQRSWPHAARAQAAVRRSRPRLPQPSSRPRTLRAGHPRCRQKARQDRPPLRRSLLPPRNLLSPGRRSRPRRLVHGRKARPDPQPAGNDPHEHRLVARPHLSRPLPRRGLQALPLSRKAGHPSRHEHHPPACRQLQRQPLLRPHRQSRLRRHTRSLSPIHPTFLAATTAGPSPPTSSTGLPNSSPSATTSLSSSPKTASPSPTRPLPTARSTIPSASPSSTVTSEPISAPIRTASLSPATSTGRWSTTGSS